MTCTANDRALAHRPFHCRYRLHASNGADHALPRALTQILRAKGRRFAEPSGEEGSWNMAGRMMAALAALWISSFAAPRSEERRVGEECVSTGRSRGSPDH